jgi:hypothetical protein
MRPIGRRVAVGFLGVLLATALPGPAVLSGSPAWGAGKPHRVFTYAKIVKLDDGTLSFRAQIQDYPDGVVALMRKTCRTCPWARSAVRRTTEFGRVFSTVPAPAEGRWYWRYRTPATPDFAVTFSSTWYTFRH